MRKLILIITFLFLIGCAASSHILVGEAREPINPSNVKIYLDYPEEYEKIALIDAGSNFVLNDPDNKIHTSVSSDGQGRSNTSTHTEKFVKAIAIYVEKD